MSPSPPTPVAGVSHVSEIGPREENQDSSFAHLNGDDGTWVIAVADGLGGHPRGDEASGSAIEGLPARIASPDEMRAAFRAAHDRVFELCPDYLIGTLSELHFVPLTTLCVAAWTPEGGLLVAWRGDTMPSLLWQGPTGRWQGRDLGLPHRYGNGTLSRFMGGSFDADDMEWQDPDWAVIHSPEGFTPASCTHAVVIASDGAWEPLIIERFGGGKPEPEQAFGVSLAAACDAHDWDTGSLNAETMAHRLLDKARGLGLKDNATIAVALMR